MVPLQDVLAFISLLSEKIKEALQSMAKQSLRVASARARRVQILHVSPHHIMGGVGSL